MMETQNIDGIIKSCRDIMRRDKGMNTDAQRLPQLLWMLFLKCFDDFERQKEVLGDHKPIIERSYRWRDWASDESGLRGEELIEFVNNELFKYLRNLKGKGSGDQRDVIADVFQEQKNFMTDGYGMKDMIQQINKLDFTSSKQFHLIGTVYEKMLLAMRDDSSGTFGEYYTPRPVIKFIVKMINPSLKDRETILDPACGTGGFLIESYSYFEEQVKGTRDNEFLQKHCLHGIEPRPDPYLFSLMNLMLHGIEEPNIARVNTLETKLSDIQGELQHDIIMTNPPFGGEEQDSIKRKLPAGFQTKDTAVGFLLHSIERLKEGGRCAIIFNNGLLSTGGLVAKVKKKLLEECNLHTIVRLPRTVFSPYTPIATNILFFDKGSRTEEIWYFDLGLSERGKTFSKTKPLKFDAFKPVIEWWGNRVENKFAWKTSIDEIISRNYNLDINHPDKEKNTYPAPDELVERIIHREKRITKIVSEIEKILRTYKE